MYPGKPKAEPTSYYTLGTSQIVKYLIQNWECHTNLVGRNILYNRLFTLIPMAQWLLDRGITSVGTLQSNQKEFQLKLKKSKTEKQTHTRFIGKRITAC